MAIRRNKKQPVTTPEEFTRLMRDALTLLGDDKEVLHERMDDLMAKVLTELGYGEGVAIFESTEKWYA